MNVKHTSNDLALAIRAANGLIDCSDDIDPELLSPDIEEEEEEEDEDQDEDLELEDDDGDDEDRGDDVDPDLPPDNDDSADDPDDDQDEDDPDPDDDIDQEALAELAGEGGKAKAVPHSRFNEVNSALKQERAERLRLEEELARAKGAAPAPKPEDQAKPYDFDAAEDRYMDAVMEGDKDKAKAIRAEIRAEERKQFEQEGAKAAKQSTAEELRQRDAQAEQANISKVASEAMAKYPFLNPQSKDANADAIEDVVARRNFYIQQGKSPSKALAMAVEKVAPRYMPKDDEPARKPGEKPSATEEQIRKNIDRAARVPQVPGGVGERGKDIDYASLSEEEFDALSAEDKKKARGDYVKEA